MITLDADNVTAGFNFLSRVGVYAAAMYSTHSHSSEKPRFRLVIPLKRPVNPHEYQAVSRRIAASIGMEIFDSTTFEPSRLMYWPSTASDGEFVFEHKDAPWLDPDEVLATYVDWKDPIQWPRAEWLEPVRKQEGSKLADPLKKSGIVGAFCRVYSISEAMETFLSEVYEPVGIDRYTYMLGSTSGGLVVYEDKWAYSHHGTDPIGGKEVNAFDLVRIHRFGDLDLNAKQNTPLNRLPSYCEMIKFCLADPEVEKEDLESRAAAARVEFDVIIDPDIPWDQKLRRTGNGGIKCTLTNMLILLENNPQLAELYYNELRGSIDSEGELPWKRIKSGWTRNDEAALAAYVDSKYQLYSSGKLKEALMKLTLERSKHPIREYLNNLPEWDGVKRVDTLLVDYLGAFDNVYTREAMRKTLCAAVARIFEPGIKFDTSLILVGPQGIGKSTVFSKLAGEYFSDSLKITDVHDKTAPEKLQGYWIVEIGEMAGLKRADDDMLKTFLSCRDDKYRASYGFGVEDHPRQCIIVGTTNHETGFLRDITGSRRFWPVKVNGESKLKAWNITERDQIWAEAMDCYYAGECLLLSDAAEPLADAARRDALESDEREGLVREFLDKPVSPKCDFQYAPDYDSLGVNNPMDKNDPLAPREYVCTLEIWCECFRKEQGDLKPQDSRNINAILKKIEGWEVFKEAGGFRYFPNYGKQRCFVRIEQTEHQN